MLIVACRLCVIDVRERFQCIGYDYTACMNYMDPMSAVPQKAVKLLWYICVTPWEYLLMY